MNLKHEDPRRPMFPGVGRRIPGLCTTLVASLTVALSAIVFALPVSASANGIVISELQFGGANGGNDEFVELLNTSQTDVDISGYQLQGCAAASGATSSRATVPADTTLQPGEHYLFTNSAGYSGSALGDSTYATGLSNEGGVRIADSTGTAIDGVGSSDGATDQCREGAGLSDIPTTGSDNAYERKSEGTQDTDQNESDFDGPQAGDPQNLSGEEVPPPPIVPIHDIQGNGSSSPLVGDNVTVEAVVTGVDDEIGASFSGTFPEDAGIFVQEEAEQQDADPNTSEGIFVGFVRDRDAYEPGDVVRLTGQVKEKFGFTIISEKFETEPEIIGTATVPTPVTIDPAQAAAQPATTKTYYETLEGMNVSLATGTANSGGTNKFGELFLTPGTEQERVFRTDPAPDLIATDADAGAGDPSNPYEPAAPSTTLVRGDLFDQVSNVVGPLAYSFDNFKIMVQPGLLPTVTDGPTEYPYDELSESTDTQVRVASFNVENYFDNVDDPGKDDNDDGERVPPTAEEEQAKRNRIADAIDRLLARPDVVAVQEVEKKEILDELATELGGYTAYLEEGNDSRGIDVGFLVKDTVTATNVRQLGKDAQNPTSETCSDVDGGLFDRPPLAADITTGEGDDALTFTVFSNHFSSKGAPDACRAAQAEFVRDEVKEIEDAGGEAIVAGDFNAFEDESALTTLEGDETTLDNQWDEAPEEERYSFAFSGKLQTLDHILLTEGLQSEVEDFRYAHFDNDYYEREGADEPDSEDGHKVSDHDPPVVTLTKPATEEPPTFGDCTIVGTRDDDNLRGTEKRDIICGFGGDDVITGLGGNDILRGGTGDDRIKGGDGADKLDGKEGDDILNGGNGPDKLKSRDGVRGNDISIGGPGPDRFDADRDDTVRE